MFYKMLKVTSATLHIFPVLVLLLKAPIYLFVFFQVYYLFFIDWCYIHKCLSTSIYIPKYVSTTFSVHVLYAYLYD